MEYFTSNITCYRVVFRKSLSLPMHFSRLAFETYAHSIVLEKYQLCFQYYGIINYTNTNETPCILFICINYKYVSLDLFTIFVFMENIITNVSTCNQEVCTYIHMNSPFSKKEIWNVISSQKFVIASRLIPQALIHFLFIV